MSIILEKSQYSGRIAALYSRLAWVYDLFTDHEPRLHKEAVEMARIEPGEAVCEVACGTGRATLDIAQRIGPGNKLVAVDLTEAMIQRARKKLQRKGLLNKVEFKHADAKALPFPDSSFDMLYNAYMFDQRRSGMQIGVGHERADPFLNLFWCERLGAEPTNRRNVHL